MPTSDASVISTVIVEVMRLNPARVLDVGPGYGKYGFLCREYLGRLERLDAVEPWPQALLAPELYDEVIAGAFPEAMPLPQGPVSIHSRSPYDALLMIDVVEHYEWIDGIAALHAALALSPVVIVSTPHRPSPQGSVGGNIFEAHVSQWTLEMLEGISTADATLIEEHSEQLLVRLDRR